MEVLDGTTIFWLITIGMTAGALTKFALWSEGVGLVSNLTAGVIGSVVVGSICIILEFPSSMIFAVLGSIAILFILNVFHLQPESTH